MKLRQGVYMSDFYLSNGERVRKSLKTREKAEAMAKERAMMHGMEQALSEGTLTATRRAATASKESQAGITLGQAFKRALRQHEKWRSSTSQRTVQENFDKVEAHFGAARLLSTIGTEDLLDYAEKLDKAKLAPSTINQRLSVVSVLFKLARTWPGSGVVSKPDIVRRTPRVGRQRRITPQEEANVISVLAASEKPKHQKMSKLVPVLLDSGLRLGESLAIRFTPGGATYADLDNHSILVRDAKAKNPCAVPMTKRAHAILQGLADEGLDAPFSDLTVDSADDCWEYARDAIELSKDSEFVIHACRHTTASRLVAAGMDTARVQRFMRHKNIATTMQYVHVEVEDLRGAAEALQNVPKSVPSSVPKRGVSKPSRASEDSLDNAECGSL